MCFFFGFLVILLYYFKCFKGVEFQANLIKGVFFFYVCQFYFVNVQVVGGSNLCIGRQVCLVFLGGIQFVDGDNGDLYFIMFWFIICFKVLEISVVGCYVFVFVSDE